MLKEIKPTAAEKLKALGQSVLDEVDAANKKHELWQRYSLSVEICRRVV
jgi:hypothetical protein